MFLLFLKRFLYSIPTLFLISILVFLSVRMVPGDPIDFLIGERGVSPEIRKEYEERLGLHRPIYQQYLLFVGRVFKGDLGHSIVTGQKVSQEFWDRFPATIELALSTLLISILLGIPLGFLSAIFHNSFLDRFLIGTSLIGYSMSIFWWGLILILFFSVKLEWTPISGSLDVFYDVPSVTGFLIIDTWLSGDSWNAFKSFIHHLILPTLTLATIPFVFIVRMTRSSLIEVLKEDFIRTAKAKGLNFYTILIRHAFKNALLPVITTIGYMLGILITGAVLTETVFSWPGIGHWLVQAVLARDYPVLQGGILIVAVFVLIVNLLTDMTYIKIDPRIKKDSI